MGIHAESGFTSAESVTASIRLAPSAITISERVKEQAVEMCIEGMSLSAAARVVGASVPTVSGWVRKKGVQARQRLHELTEMADKRSFRRNPSRCHSVRRDVDIRCG